VEGATTVSITIKPGDIGNFSSVEQSRAYNAAMSVRKDIEDAAHNLIACDDVASIDINGSNKGNVLVDNAPLPSRGMYTGKVTYDTATGEITHADVSVHTVGGKSDRSEQCDNHYRFQEIGTTQVYERDTDVHWREDWKQGENSHKEKVILHKNTGEMEYLFSPGRSFIAMTNPWT
jgi:hypothetical protein